MEPAFDQQDRIVGTGERPFVVDNSTEQPLSPKDERIVSASLYPDAAIIGSSRDVAEQAGASDAVGDVGIIHPPTPYAAYEQNMSRGGYADSIGIWDGYPQYVNPEGMHLSPFIYNENPSLLFHSGFGFNPEMVYGQYSPIATPLHSMMMEGQLYSPQQFPFSPTFYPQHGQQHAPATLSSAVPVSPPELMTSESSGENLLFGPGSGYLVPFGSLGGGNISGNPATNPLTSPVAYPQVMGILGSYEQNVVQRQMHGYGPASSSVGGYSVGLSYQSPNFTTHSISYLGADDQSRSNVDKGRRRERDQESICISNDSHGVDHNRGPRASKLKGKNISEESSSSANGKNNLASCETYRTFYNQPDFVTEYENAKFFIIKSFSEDNVHKSIKYSVWASTPHGNKKLDAAYHEANAMQGKCPVFLFFSVNASGQFCGVAEMVGPVDFERDADYWQQERWSGQFPVKWHIIKDVPNNRFRHILLHNNDNKPVTHSRDSQEVQFPNSLFKTVVLIYFWELEIFQAFFLCPSEGVC
ncbi:uncharacterized protein LOC110811325 isoform X1 [Carica papaya]|uniref:uncharacterized protein LOC110811325 isoform X1 n=2 Tax=Carica papaya TaxID=3649 RepID=UPI000B8CFF78|nr:uncharacterized protein LOC110811325 isoform X1 [Carica papaya]